MMTAPLKVNILAAAIRVDNSMRYGPNVHDRELKKRRAAPAFQVRVLSRGCIILVHKICRDKQYKIDFCNERNFLQRGS